MKTIKRAISIIILIGVLGLIDAGAAFMALGTILLILSILYIVEHIKSDTMTEQKELIFHDTVPLPAEQLEKGRKKAENQKDRILMIFQANPDLWFTPYQIQAIHDEVFGPILISSVRRSITDLTNDGITGHGRLLKGSHDKQVKEQWHTNNNRWKYNYDHIDTLNKK